MTENRREYIEKVKENLGQLDARIEVFEARANEKQGEMRRDYEAVLNQIRESREKARERLEDLRDAPQTAWDDVKLAAEHAWTSLARAVDRASDRFQ